VKSPWHSDHLCFSTFGGVVLHDLLPIPFKVNTAIGLHVSDRRKSTVFQLAPNVSA